MCLCSGSSVGMYAALCKEIGNIIVGVVCGAYALIVLYTQKYKVCLHVCVCVCVCVCCCCMNKQNSPYSVFPLVWTLRWPV